MYVHQRKGADELEDGKKVTINNEDGDSAELNFNLSADGEINSEEESQPQPENQPEEKFDFDGAIKNLQSELAAKNDRILRLQADFDNFRKRTAKEKIELRALIEQEFLTDLLPLLDNLGRASAAAEDENSDAETVRKGLEMINRETVNAMTRHGLEVIDTENKMFDPNFHQAVGTIQDAEKEDGAIAAEFQRGYTVRGKVIRPAMVQVVNNS